MIHPVILCGGSGTRLWPSSRAAYPKQFAPLIGQESLYQATLRRFAAPGFAAPLVMTGDAFRFLASEQAAETRLSDPRVVIEPEGRDTAPAILTAALMLVEEDPEALILVAPSDHLIADPDAFRAAVERGARTAAAGRLVTFGIVPDRAETGYGYLELDRAPQDGEPVPLVSFREKPDAEAAEAMIASGRHFWNGGIFLLRAGDAVAAFEAHAPDLLAPVRSAIADGTRDLGFMRLGASYLEARAISVDYAIMEPAAAAGDVAAVPLDCGWTDLGSWQALWQSAGQQEDGVVRSGPVTAIDCRESLLRSEEGVGAPRRLGARADRGGGDA